ncbi:hypothetical protein VUR80DRAFT_6508 [Thermomyces stellatus]
MVVLAQDGAACKGVNRYGVNHGTAHRTVQVSRWARRVFRAICTMTWKLGGWFSMRTETMRLGSPYVR